MPQMYTEENFIKLLYGEADLFEKLELEFALDEDSSLVEYCAEIKEGFESLKPISLRPSERIIEKILAYSRNT